MEPVWVSLVRWKRYCCGLLEMTTRPSVMHLLGEQCPMICSGGSFYFFSITKRERQRVITHMPSSFWEVHHRGLSDKSWSNYTCHWFPIWPHLTLSVLWPLHQVEIAVNAHWQCVIGKCHVHVYCCCNGFTATLTTPLVSDFTCFPPPTGRICITCIANLSS